MNQNFGQRIKALREARGLNQTQFAKLCNLTQAAISQFEDNKRSPSSPALHKIANGLNISFDELLGTEPAPIAPEKEAAIQALVAILRQKPVTAEAIVALAKFVEHLPDKK